MSNYRFRSKLDEAMVAVVILAGIAAAAAMEFGAMRSAFQHTAAAMVAHAAAADGAASRVAAAQAPSHVPRARSASRIRG